MSDSKIANDEGLVRVIGTGALGLSVVNMVVGAGIFVLPGLVAAVLGPAAILAYLICSVTVALVFLCFAEVGSRVIRSGGSYAYIEEAFGQWHRACLDLNLQIVQRRRRLLLPPMKYLGAGAARCSW